MSAGDRPPPGPARSGQEPIAGEAAGSSYLPVGIHRRQAFTLKASVPRPKSASQVRHASLDPLLLPTVKATAVFVFETDVFVPDLLGYLAYVTTVPRTRTRVAIAGGRLARERHGQAVGNGCYRRYPWCSRYARTYAADFGRRTLGACISEIRTEHHRVAAGFPAGTCQVRPARTGTSPLRARTGRRWRRLT